MTDHTIVVEIVIFGTGSNGERAWHAAASRNDVAVVSFADNDPRKQGTRFHDRAVVGADQLQGMHWDFVLIASMFSRDIREQLVALGVQADSIVAPDPNTFAEAIAALPARKHARRRIDLGDGTSVVAADLPEVLILTHETLNGSHGTGVLLHRYFSEFPSSKLFSVCQAAAGSPWLESSLELPPSLSVSGRAEALADALQRRSFLPRLVYATSFNENDLALLDLVLSVLPPGTPVVQHFMDYMPHDSAAFDDAFRQLGDRIGDVWALTGSLAADLARRYERPVELVTALHQEPPSLAKTSYRPLDGESRAVILGNLWQPSTLPVIREVWSKCREAIPGLRPIDWYVHPARVQALIDAGYDLGDEVVWRGFYRGSALQERLRQADLALLPFNTDAAAQDGYARFSLPSRLTELCGAGLPIFALASPDTEPARFLRDRECGVSASGHDAAVAAAELIRVLSDHELRERIGKRAREVAETELTIGPHQKELLRALVRIADKYQPPAGWAGHRENLVRLAGSEHTRSARLADVVSDRVHYACGRNVLPGWLNVDGFDASFPSGAVPPEIGAQILRMDLTAPHPFPDDCFRLGYSEDFVEHLDQSAFVSFLCEAYRTFQSGGVLRVSTPGLEGILRRHLRGSDWSAASVLHEEAYVQWRHKHFLCFEAVEQIAHRIGWREVRQCTYGESSIPELRLETRPDQADLNLIVELVK